VAVSLPSTVTLGYDSNENLTNTRSCLLAYDCLNQLTNISYTNAALFPTGGRTELRYDGLGRLRVRREYTNTASPALVEEVRYVYCGMEAIQERDGNNNPRVSYTLGGGFLARTDTNGSAYYHTDGNGNVTAMVDEQGRIKARYLYDPFGNLLAQYGDLADTNTRRFSGKEFHARSGLYYYGFRWYDPNLQRWINADPIGLAGGRNKHAFVGNNPINEVDYLGLERSVWVQLFRDIFLGESDSGLDQHSNLAQRNRTGTGIASLADEDGSTVSPGDAVIVIGGKVLQGGFEAGTLFIGGAEGKVAEKITTGVTKAGKLSKCSNAAKTAPNLKHLDDVLEEAARLEKQWPQQLQALEKSGQPLAALTSNVKGGLQKLSKSSGLHQGELSRRFHQIKARGDTPGARQNNWIDDVTGDVLDGNRNYIGNVFDDF